MERIAFKMQLLPGKEAEYKRRHDEIWPELRSSLEEAGVRDYSIFLDENTHCLFAVMKAVDSAKLAGLRSTFIMQKWWDYMADLMHSNPDNSPVRVLLTEVFHLP